MEDFKANPKMQCFKEGGQVKYESRKEHAEEIKADINQDKKIVKKAISMHDKQEHKGEKTDLSKLNKGGRAKKSKGTVKKYQAGGYVPVSEKTVVDNMFKSAPSKTPAAAPSAAVKLSPEAQKFDLNKTVKEAAYKKKGGSINNVYEAKKSSGDKDNIQKVKDIKAVKLCGGKSVKKMADGGMAGQGAISGAERAALQGALPNKVNDIERMRMAARAKNAMKYLGPAQQSQFVNQGGMGNANAPSAPVNQLGGTPGASNMGAPVGSTIPAQKRGGKIKKACK